MSAIANPEPANESTVDLGGLSIGDIVDALSVGLLQNITMVIALDTLSNNFASAAVRIKNPLSVELTLVSASSEAGLNGTTYAESTHNFIPPLVVPKDGTVDSPLINNVRLVQGAGATLGIAAFRILDLQNIDIVVKAGSTSGGGGISIPINGLKENSVPTLWDIQFA